MPTSLIDKTIISHIQIQKKKKKKATATSAGNQLTSWPYVKRGISEATEAASNSDGAWITEPFTCEP